MIIDDHAPNQREIVDAFNIFSTRYKFILAKCFQHEYNLFNKSTIFIYFLTFLYWIFVYTKSTVMYIIFPDVYNICIICDKTICQYPVICYDICILY